MRICVRKIICYLNIKRQSCISSELVKYSPSHNIICLHIVQLCVHPRNVIYIKIRNTKNLNRTFFILRKKVPKIFTNPPNNLIKKNHKNSCIFLAIMYIRHRNVEDSMSKTYADAGT